MRFPLSIILATLALAASCPAGVIVIGKLARESPVQPGDGFEGVILLKNTDDIPAQASVFQTDYLFYADGTNEYGEPGSVPRSNANWITVSPTRLQIEPGETAAVRYSGTVPVKAGNGGTFWSMIMVEPNSVPAMAPDGNSGEVAVGLQTKVRFGIQIVTEVGQGAAASLQVMDKRLLQDGAGRVFELDIANDGDRLLIPSVTVELFNRDGASVGLFDAGATRIYPGCSVRKRVKLDNVPAGEYAAMVLLDSGDLQVMGARYDLVLSP